MLLFSMFFFFCPKWLILSEIYSLEDHFHITHILRYYKPLWCIPKTAENQHEQSHIYYWESAMHQKHGYFMIFDQNAKFIWKIKFKTRLTLITQWQYLTTVSNKNSTGTEMVVEQVGFFGTFPILLSVILHVLLEILKGGGMETKWKPKLLSISNEIALTLELSGGLWLPG